MTNRFPECEDCAFNGVEPAICDECYDADQFEYGETEDSGVRATPIYFRDWKNAA